jgi:hypothetical protein
MSQPAPEGRALGEPTNVLILMQNPWSGWYEKLQGYDEEEPISARHKVWAREDWLQATRKSKSGRTLLQLFPEVPCDDQYGPRWPPPGVWVDDATLKVTATPRGSEPADLDYVRRLIAAKRPRVVLACGKSAEGACLKLWGGALVAMPHPAYRGLNPATVAAAREGVRAALAGQPVRRRLAPTRDGGCTVNVIGGGDIEMPSLFGGRD